MGDLVIDYPVSNMEYLKGAEIMGYSSDKI
ncbi:MAG: hypothetical protein Hyperionvirus1_48 [Hyperionvirus sp.]|uniref:Uncharacterized protein n=1 Tax=Hyperionvirus sp. TaxID=2487770 RepID=A0A3G5AAW6_9VIRU|nr:MAG: hypothetical protein Hyperionvirus1_48 [Hyperionvirus sp.]